MLGNIEESCSGCFCPLAFGLGSFFVDVRCLLFVFVLFSVVCLICFYGLVCLPGVYGVCVVLDGF